MDMAGLRHLQRRVYRSLRRWILKERGAPRRCPSRHTSTVTKPSSLFVSNAVAQHTASVQADLALDHRLTTGLDALRESVQHRGLNTDLHTLVEDFKLLRELESRKTTLEEERESIAGMMKSLVTAQVKSEDVQRSKEVLISQGKSVRESLKALMPQLWDVEERVMLTSLRLPNDLHPDTPNGTDPFVVKETKFENVDGHDSGLSHAQLGQKHGWIKFSNVGPTAYYLFGQMAVLEQALQSYVSHTLRHSGFTQLSCPEVFRSAVVEGSGIDIHNPGEVYSLSYHPKEDKPHPKIANSYHLAGVSLSSFTAYLSRTTTKSSSLPLRYFSVGRTYSPRDINYRTGLYRTSQSIQAHAFTGCQTIGECDEAKGHLEDVAMEMCTDLQIPVRLVRVPASRLQPHEMYRSEVQVWSQPYQQYIQIGHVSVLGDYISRRLNINTEDQSGSPRYITMVHGCMLNVTRVLGTLLERRFDQSNKSIIVPEKLQPHLTMFL